MRPTVYATDTRGYFAGSRSLGKAPSCGARSFFGPVIEATLSAGVRVALTATLLRLVADCNCRTSGLPRLSLNL